MCTPLISVIVPIYNVEPYLDECILSIRNQTYKNLQIILVDDGSTDFSGKICDKHALEDDRITTIHQENQGLVIARKKGLELADGEYVGFVDGDDYIEPQMYETLLLELCRAKADMIHTFDLQNSGRYYKGATRVISLEENRIETLQNFINGKLGILPSIWSKLFKKDFIREAYAFVKNDVCYGEDLVCICALLLIANKICILDKAFYHYRIRESSLSHSVGRENIRKEIMMYVNIYDVLKQFNICDIMETVMDSFLITHVIMGLEHIGPHKNHIPRFYFPAPEKVQNKKILLYGAGAVGRDYYAQISCYSNCEIVAWVDAHPEKYDYPYIELHDPDILSHISYDLVLVAVKSEEKYRDIEKELKNRNISAGKIMWKKPADMLFEKA